MSNGHVRDAELQALLRDIPEDDKVTRWLVTSVFWMPETVGKAIEKQRRRDIRAIAALATTVATIVSLATPYLVRLFY